MHGAINTARLGVRVHGGGGGDAVRRVGGEGARPRGEGPSALLARVLAATSGGSFPFPCQNAR